MGFILRAMPQTRIPQLFEERTPEIYSPRGKRNGKLLLDESGCTRVLGEPAQNTVFKLLVRSRPRHGVACVRNQPELGATGIGFGQDHGMARTDAPVSCAMDQQDRDR